MRIVFLAFALTACASTGSILAEPPDRVYSSARSALDVGNCLRVELSESGRNPIVIENDGSTVFLFKNSYGATDLAFTVIPAEGDPRDGHVGAARLERAKRGQHCRRPGLIVVLPKIVVQALQLVTGPAEILHHPGEGDRPVRFPLLPPPEAFHDCRERGRRLVPERGLVLPGVNPRREQV
jgi:hypothetical protein